MAPPPLPILVPPVAPVLPPAPVRAVQELGPLLGQSVDQLAIASEVSGRATVRVSLDVGGVGRIDLQLERQAAGVISGALATHDPATRAVLEAALPELRRSLEDRGLRLGELTAPPPAASSAGDRPQDRSRQPGSGSPDSLAGGDGSCQPGGRSPRSPRPRVHGAPDWIG